VKKMKNEILPIGSIVRVKEKDLMIVAYMKKEAVINDQSFDYACCFYPDGLGEKAILIKKEDIERVVFIGFQDARFIEFRKQMENENA